MFLTRKLYDDKPKWFESHGFSIVLRGLSILSIIAGFILGAKAGKQWNGYSWETNELLSGFIYLSGIVAAIWWWAVAIIVDACTKYLLKK